MYAFSLLRTIIFVLLASPMLALWQSCKDPLEGDIERQKRLIGKSSASNDTTTNNTWQRVQGLGDSTVWSMAANATTLIVGMRTEAGAFRSVDNGTTWSATSLNNRAVRPILSFNNVFFAGTNFGTIVRSVDNGLTWTEINSWLEMNLARFNAGQAKLYPRAFIALGSVLFASANTEGQTTYEKVIMRSLDNGTTWTLVHTADTPLAVSITSFAVLGRSVYAAFGNTEAGILRSNDNGMTWNKLTATLPSSAQTITSNQTTLLAATNNAVYRSSDSGATWQAATVQPPTGAGITCLVVGNGTTFFAGTYNSGVFRSDDNGWAWQPLNPGMTIKQVSALALRGNVLFAGADGFGVFRLSVR
jgi:Photosynthesis system II assembly factor YCF48